MKILIPLDGTPLAESVLPHICELVNSPAEAVLVRVAPDVTAPIEAEASGRIISPWEQRHNLKGTYLRYLERVGSEKLGGCLTITAQVLFGKPAEEILAAAREHKVDLIAMATHGRHGLSRLVHGSVASQVLEDSEIPVVLFMAPKQVTRSVSREVVE